MMAACVMVLATTRQPGSLLYSSRQGKQLQVDTHEPHVSQRFHTEPHNNIVSGLALEYLFRLASNSTSGSFYVFLKLHAGPA